MIKKLTALLLIGILCTSMHCPAAHIILENSHIGNITLSGGSTITIGGFPDISSEVLLISLASGITFGLIIGFLLEEKQLKQVTKNASSITKSLMRSWKAFWRNITKLTTSRTSTTYYRTRSASPVITDAGEIETKIVNIPGINNFIIKNIGELRISLCNQDEQEQLTISADKNILLHLYHVNKNNELHLGTNSNIQTQTPVIFSAAVKSLARISAENNTKVITHDTFKAKKITLQTSNNAKITASVITETLTIEETNSSTITINGSSNIQNINLSNDVTYNASSFDSDTVNITASNSANAQIMAQKRIDYNLSNLSKVSYRGSPNLLGTTSNLAQITKA